MSKNKRNHNAPNTQIRTAQSTLLINEVTNLWLGMCETVVTNPIILHGALGKSLVNIITNFQVYRFTFRVWLLWINTVHVVIIL